jgi:hypothetical protein
MQKSLPLKVVTLLLSSLYASFAYGQVPLNAITEHFTNTNCGVCASRNPNLLTNLNNYPNVNYISIHPSSPFASCLLSMQNKISNDARTNFYSIFGGTPRIVINGQAIANNINYSTATLFSNLATLTSDFSVRVESLQNTDSITNKIIIKKHSATKTYVGSSLFLGAVEDTVTYTGTNGEAKHYNVLRKVIQNNTAITLPVNINDSVILNTATLTKSNIWDWDRMKIVAVLMDNNKQLIQSKIQEPEIAVVAPFTLDENEVILSNQAPSALLTAYPNPSTGDVKIYSNLKHKINAQLITFNGVVEVLEVQPGINNLKLNTGAYLLNFLNAGKAIKSTKLLVQ